MLQQMLIKLVRDVIELCHVIFLFSASAQDAVFSTSVGDDQTSHQSATAQRRGEGRGLIRQISPLL